MEKGYALLVAGVMHTLRPFRGREGPQKQFRWRSYRDGVPDRLWRCKAEWERAVPFLPAPPPLPDGPQIRAAYRAEAWAAHEASVLLDTIRRGE